MKKRPHPHTCRRPRSKASTPEVLGKRKRHSAVVPPKWREYYDHLVDLRDAFLRRQGDLSRDAAERTPGFSTHMADAGTDTYDRDLALGMLSADQDALYQIEQALDRIQNDTYGICELTGKPIPPGRLAAVPWTRFSAEAEKQLEQQGFRKRTRLGPRAAVTQAEPGETIPKEDPA